MEKHITAISMQSENEITPQMIESAKEYLIDSLIDFKRNNAPCIFHDEKTPSMHFYKDRNMVFCFGCNKSGDSIDVYMQLYGVGWKEAVIALGGGIL